LHLRHYIIRKVPILTVVVFVLSALSCELFIRLVQPSESTYALTLTNPLLITRYTPAIDRLAEFETATKSETINCIIVGSSVAEYLDPALLEQRYNEQTGEALDCMNLALMDASASSIAVEIGLVLRDDPDVRFIVWGVQAHTFFSDVRFAENSFSESPWVQYRLGRFSIDGWLFDHSYLFRALKTYLPLLYSPDQRVATYQENVSERNGHGLNAPSQKGYSAVLTYKDSAPLFSPDEEDYIHYLTALSTPSPDDWHAMDSISALAQAKHVHVIMVEVPAAVPDGPAKDFLAEVASYARQRDLPFLTTDNLRLPATAFFDSVISTQRKFIHNHLHVSGSIMFSDWLGTYLGRAASQGAFDDVHSPVWTPAQQTLVPHYNVTLGLSPDDYLRYQTYRRTTFDLLPLKASILNPSPAELDRLFLQSSLGLLFEWQGSPPTQSQQEVFDLLTLFSMMRYPGELKLSPFQQHMLEAWRASPDPAALNALDIDYLLCREQPGDNPAQDCPAGIQDHPGYTLLGHWKYAPLYETYSLYRIN
jgi:hypothetical protein